MIQDAMGRIETQNANAKRNNARKTGRGGDMQSTGANDARMVKLNVARGLALYFGYGWIGEYLAGNRIQHGARTFDV